MPKRARERALPTFSQPRPRKGAASLLYLMSYYMRSGCPRLALCVSRHMHCLAAHPDAAPVVRDICAGLHGAWLEAALPRPEQALD